MQCEYTSSAQHSGLEAYSKTYGTHNSHGYNVKPRPLEPLSETRSAVEHAITRIRCSAFSSVMAPTMPAASLLAHCRRGVGIRCTSPPVEETHAEG